jgi:hypothetical protein
MRNTILTILIILGASISMTSCSQTKNCKTYRTGKFILIDTQKSLEYTIERNDSIQTETNLKTGQISKYKIDWESECKFSLTIIEGRQELLDFYKNKKLYIEIVEIYTDGYKFSAKLDGFDQIKCQTVRKTE